LRTGICLDAEGAVWVGTGGFSVARVAPGGEVLHRVELPENRAPFAWMLGGPDRRTLFILTAEWRLADGHVANLDRLAGGPRTGQILTLPVSVPGVGGHDHLAGQAWPLCSRTVITASSEPRPGQRAR
jgi:sugar lactone lactonase YvrE